MNGSSAHHVVPKEPVRRPPRGGQVTLRSVSVNYGGRHSSRALDDVDFILQPGLVHGLIGPNGSGKSTLIKVLAGLVFPESGARLVTDAAGEVPLRLDPQSAKEFGFRFLHQDRALVPELTVLENFFLGRSWPGSPIRIDKNGAQRDLERMLTLVDVDLPSERQVLGLTDADRVFLGLARAIADVVGGTGFLVLDEPTAAMNSDQVEHLFEILRELVAPGDIGVVFVGHRLQEILAIADKVTALSEGHVVLERARGDLGESILLEVLGAGHSPTADQGQPEPVTTVAAADHDRSQEPTLTIRGLKGSAISGISLSLEPGVIVGVTSLDGPSLHEMASVLAGVTRPFAGSVRLADVHLEGRRPEVIRSAGLGFVPADRRHQGGISELSVEENLFLSRADMCWERGWFRGSRRRRLAREILEQFEVRPPDPRVPFGTLSGGNQQKVILARWMAAHIPVLVLHEPTLGVDVAARHTIYDLLRQRAQRGLATLVISSDVEEVVTVCDRVAVLVDGFLEEELSGSQLTPESVLAACFGRSKQGGLSS